MDTMCINSMKMLKTNTKEDNYPTTATDVFAPQFCAYTNKICESSRVMKSYADQIGTEKKPTMTELMQNKAVQTEPVCIAKDLVPAQTQEIFEITNQWVQMLLDQQENLGNEDSSSNDIQSIKPGEEKQSIKIDALWKPIIRKFRQFIKLCVMQKLNNDLGKVSDEANQGLLFGQILNVPEELLALDRTRLALYMIVQSSKITS